MSTDQLDPVQQASATLLEQIWQPAFFSALAEKGHEVKTAEDAAHAVNLAIQLNVAQEVQGQQGDSKEASLFAKANEKVAAELQDVLPQTPVVAPQVAEAMQVLATAGEAPAGLDREV